MSLTEGDNTPGLPQLIIRRAGPSDIPVLRDLADRIWRVCYATILSAAQIDYMLAWMYGPDTIAAELAGDIDWYLAFATAQPVGFFSVTLRRGDTADLNKLYLLPTFQGRGYGQTLLAKAERLAIGHGCTVLRLRVNKTNVRALRAYSRAGFHQVDALVADIGQGFVMDDFVLAKAVPRRG